MFTLEETYKIQKFGMPNAAKTCLVTHPEMEDEGDDGRALHEVHPVLRQPVEGLQEQQQHEQSHELWRKIVPGHTEQNLRAVLSIRIRMFLCLPDPDQLARGTDPDLTTDPDPSMGKL